MKHLLIITYYWPPCGGAGVRRWLKLSKYLSRQGVKVHILTVDPEKASYPIIDNNLCNDIDSNITVHTTNTFEPFELYKKVSGSSDIPYAGFANEQKPSFFKKVSRFIRGNFFIPDPRKGWNKFAVKKAQELIDKYKIDTVITTSPPHSSQLIGLKLKQKNNIKWIADLRDPWTDLFYLKDFYPTRLAMLINKKLELKVLTQADAVLTVSESLKQTFADKSAAINADKIKVLPNGFDPEDFGETTPCNNEIFTITYGGSLSEHQPINIFLDAVCKLIDKGEAIKIKFIGNFSDKVKHDIRALNLEKHTNFTGYLSHTNALSEMTQSDAFLLVVPQTPDNKGILTFKYFEYIAMQRPVVAIGPTDGDLAEIINKTKTGTIVDYNNAESMEGYLSKLILAKKTGDNCFTENSNYTDYSFEKIAKSLFDNQ